MRTKNKNGTWVLMMVSMALLTMCLNGNLLAADHYWDGNTDGDGDNIHWTDPYNWDLDNVPGNPTEAGDWVLINLGVGLGPVLDQDTNDTYGLIIDNGTVTFKDNAFYRTKSTTRVGATAGTTGVFNIEGGSFLANFNRWVGLKHFYVGFDGNGTFNVSGGWAGCITYTYVGGNVGSIGQMNVSGGEYWGKWNIWVGQDGSGTLNQTGGYISIGDSTHTLRPGPNGVINLNGGETYVPRAPIVVSPGVININGGRLCSATSVEAAITGLITSGAIVGANGSIDPNDGNWKIEVAQPEETRWDFAVISFESPIPPCKLNVIPYKARDVVVGAGTLTDFEYTVSNEGVSSVNYTVAESPDQPWLTLDKTSGSVAGSADGKSGGTDIVTATVDASSLTPGTTYTVDLVFSDDCASPAGTYTRTLNVEVAECTWDVSPGPGPIYVWADCASPQDYIYTVTNSAISINDLSYTVEETDVDGNPMDHPWITLSKTSGGPIAPDNSDAVIVTVSATQLDQSGYIKFTPTCGTGVNAEIREIVQLYASDATGQYGFVPLVGYKHAYLGDVDPLAMDSCKHVPPDGEVLGECTFVVTEGQAGFSGAIIGTVVDDPEAENGKAFYIDRTEVGRAGYSSHVYDAVTETNKDTFIGQLGFTMVARIKVTHNDNMGACLYAINDGTGDNPGMQCAIRTGWGGAGPSLTGQIREYYNKNSDGSYPTSAQLATTTEEQNAYHIIRVAVGGGVYDQGTTYLAWYDEDPVPVIAAGNTVGSGYHFLPDRFGFGIYGNAADIYFDWISFTNMGMYGPGEEDSCIGTLIPEPFSCGEIFADTDDLDGDGRPDGDGDVDQDDFAVFQACYTGDGTFDLSSMCACFDRDNDDDVDSSDYGQFENCASGPAIAADPTCDDPAP